MKAEQLAKLFHETYEFLAPGFGYKTREASAKPWEDVPENNKKLMIAVAEKVLLVVDTELHKDHGFTKKQQEAYDAIMAGKNPSVDWPRASGKTYLYNKIKEDVALIRKAFEAHFEGTQE